MLIKTLAALALAAGACLSALPAAAQVAPDAVRVSAARAGGTQVLPLARGRSAYVDLPADARDVLVSNPAVADVVLRTPRRYYVVANGPGQADAVFFDAAGNQILSLDIRVGQDSATLHDIIRRVVPNARVRVETVNESLILTGSVANNSEADQVVRLAGTFVPDPRQVVNMLSVAGRDQVMLRVRIIEVERSVLRQFGFNMQAILNQVGEPQYLFGSALGFATNGGIQGGLRSGFNLDTTRQPTLVVPCAPGVNGTCLDVFRDDSVVSNSETAQITNTAGDPGLNQAETTIQALERVGLVRTLAEPNLTSVSGEASRMLAGGEFPIPSGVDQNGQITVTFKPFGVGLAFTPTVLSEGRISLKIAVEVSELSASGTFTYGPANARISIPALTVRRTENTVELPSGGAMMVAGLLQERSRQTIDRIPGAGSLPIIGSLFRSRDFVSGETELVVLVTPYLVGATSPQNLQTPADGLIMANDAQTILFGRLNQRYRPAAADGARRWMGPVGWALD